MNDKKAAKEIIKMFSELSELSDVEFERQTLTKIKEDFETWRISVKRNVWDHMLDLHEGYICDELSSDRYFGNDVIVLFDRKKQSIEIRSGEFVAVF